MILPKPFMDIVLLAQGILLLNGLTLLLLILHAFCFGENMAMCRFAREF